MFDIDKILLHFHVINIFCSYQHPKNMKEIIFTFLSAYLTKQLSLREGSYTNAIP